MERLSDQIAETLVEKKRELRKSGMKNPEALAWRALHLVEQSRLADRDARITPLQRAVERHRESWERKAKDIAKAKDEAIEAALALANAVRLVDDPAVRLAVHKFKVLAGRTRRNTI